MPKLKYLIIIPLMLFSVFAVAEEAMQKRHAYPQVLLETSAGAITLELYPAKAPKTVANFLKYVESGFYNGTIFHRVIDDFMIQGGGFTTDYVKKKTRAPIMNEADNGFRNNVGTIAMARTSDPHSATAQFFINVKNNSFLDFRESVFVPGAMPSLDESSKEWISSPRSKVHRRELPVPLVRMSQKPKLLLTMQPSLQQ